MSIDEIGQVVDFMVDNRPEVFFGVVLGNVSGFGW